MNAVAGEVAGQVTDSFWDRLRALESRHQHVQTEHETVRRDLDAMYTTAADDDLRDAWQRYCSVIAELDRTSEEFTQLRLQST